MDTGERLTWPQVRERYPDQWVVLVDHDSLEQDLTRYNTARVLARGASRAEAIASARPALDSYEGYGCHYTGTIRGPMFQLKQFQLELEPEGAASRDTACREPDRRVGPRISTTVDASERLTWPQVRERYPDQWVVLVDHDWHKDDPTRYDTARPLACGASRAEAIARARPALDSYEGYGCRYTGTIRGPMSQLKQLLLERGR
jgi:hypothetical protein